MKYKANETTLFRSIWRRQTATMTSWNRNKRSLFEVNFRVPSPSPLRYRRCQSVKQSICHVVPRAFQSVSGFSRTCSPQPTGASAMQSAINLRRVASLGVRLRCVYTLTEERKNSIHFKRSSWGQPAGHPEDRTSWTGALSEPAQRKPVRAGRVLCIQYWTTRKVRTHIPTSNSVAFNCMNAFV